MRDAAAHFSKYLQDPQMLSKIEGDLGPFCYIWSDAAFDTKYYQTFNRTWFFSFSKIFKVPEIGMGQSFKMSMIERAANDKAIISTVMKEGNVYKVKAIEALEYINSHRTFRTPSTETENEGSIPVRMLQRMDPIR